MSIRSWRNGRRLAIWVKQTRSLNKWAAARIAAGDMDFDDIVYRTRDASAVLLSIWDKEEA